MTWQRELGLKKLAELRRQLEYSAARHPMTPKPTPLFVRHAEAWFPPPETLCWRAYQQWIMEQVS